MSTQFVLVSAFIPWNDKILLVKRAHNDDFLPGYWEQVGGKIDFGENPYDAVIREVKEESGLDIKPLKPYFTIDEMTPDGRQAIEIAFHCEILGEPQVTLSHEHQEVLWMTEQNFHTLSPMSPFMKTIILRGFETI